MYLTTLGLIPLTVLMMHLFWKQIGKLRVEIAFLPTKKKQGNQILDHLVGELLWRFLPIAPGNRKYTHLVLVTPSCGVCIEHMEELVELGGDRLRDQVLCIVFHEGGNLASFREKYAPFLNMEDFPKELLERMSVQMTPCFLQIDQEGVILDVSYHLKSFLHSLKGGE